MNVLSIRHQLAQSGPKLARYLFGSPLNRPSPPPLPPDQQREFEELVRNAQAPLGSSPADQSEAQLSMHPDARKPVQPDFEGDANPVTGEIGGPKKEPVRKWGREGGGDWSYAGRVTDF